MKVKISSKRIVLMWLAVYLVFAGIISLIFFNLFYLSKWDARQPVFIFLYTATMLVILIVSIKTHYYEINKKDITVSKLGKKYTYFYSDIIYIDFEQSEKGKSLCFVTKLGHVKYLTFDKEGKIYTAAKSRCTNLISREELEAKFPGIKI